MKIIKLTAIILSISMCILLTGCKSVLVNTEVEEVNAFVTKAYKSNYGSFVTIEYGGIQATWENPDLYGAYINRIGKIIKCNMIIRTYESGKITKELAYNVELIE